MHADVFGLGAATRHEDYDALDAAGWDSSSSVVGLPALRLQRLAAGCPSRRG